MSNKKTGNDFEQDFCKLLASNGFWAHNMANRKNGQPADVIAVKDGCAYLIDCKVCKNDYFNSERIEENQHFAMRKWELCGNNKGWFALKTSKGVYMVSYRAMQHFYDVTGKKVFNINNIDALGIKVDAWIKFGGDLEC